jgi:hypothetical protein
MGRLSMICTAKYCDSRKDRQVRMHETQIRTSFVSPGWMIRAVEDLKHGLVPTSRITAWSVQPISWQFFAMMPCRQPIISFW